MCFSKMVAMVSKDTSNANDNVQTESSQNYLDAISDDSDHSVTAWYIQAMVNNHEVVFKVDMGAEVTRRYVMLSASPDSINQQRYFVD